MVRVGWIPWRTCEARKVLRLDLQPGGYLFDKDDISAEVAYEHYVTMPEFANVVFSQFKFQLAAHRKQAKTNTDWTDWKKCPGRQVLIDDLQPGGLLFEKPEITAEEAFEFYTTLPEFARVVFSQFKVRLESHREQANVQSRAAHEDMQAFLHDRRLFPRQGHNGRGEPVFDMSTAKYLLRKDVCEKRHTTMTPSCFQKTRPEYMLFKPDIFKFRIYQEERLQKYFNYLDWKRKKKNNGNDRSSRSHDFSHGNRMDTA
jgi:hypothetical protein